MNEPIYFANEGELWEWYSHQSLGLQEVWLGLYKKSSRLPSITFLDAMEMALCFGWSESKWKTIDQQRFCIRFTPRKPKEAWSPLSSKRYLELEAMGMVQEPGRRAWESRNVAATDQMLLASEATAFPPAQQALLEADPSLLAHWNGIGITEQKSILRWVHRPLNPKLIQLRFQAFIDSYRTNGKLKMR